MPRRQAVAGGGRVGSDLHGRGPELPAGEPAEQLANDWTAGQRRLSFGLPAALELGRLARQVGVGGSGAALGGVAGAPLPGTAALCGCLTPPVLHERQTVCTDLPALFGRLKDFSDATNATR
jgi:hypothetical protein